MKLDVGARDMIALVLLFPGPGSYFRDKNAAIVNP